MPSGTAWALPGAPLPVSKVAVILKRPPDRQSVVWSGTQGAAPGATTTLSKFASRRPPVCGASRAENSTECAKEMLNVAVESVQEPAAVTSGVSMIGPGGGGPEQSVVGKGTIT